MFEIGLKNKITLTRGDTACIKVAFDDYEPADGDVIELSVKRNIADETPVLHKLAKDGVFTFSPADTINLIGMFVYDIQLTTSVGAVYTPIQSTFLIKRGVTE